MIGLHWGELATAYRVHVTGARFVTSPAVVAAWLGYRPVPEVAPTATNFRS